MSKKEKLQYQTIQVDDKVYSAESLAQMHPGGDLFVKAFAGRDATEAFLSYHRRKFPHPRMESALVGKAIPLKNEDDDKDFLELCEIIEKVVPTHKSFAPPIYFVKAFLLIGSSIALELYMHINQQYVWYLSAIVGFLYAQIGLNIQHDANHGALSKNPLVNRFFGLTQNFIGGSAIDWIHQHVVQHHIHCNDMDEDPDIAGTSILRVNPKQPLMQYHFIQHIYIFFVIALFGFNVVVSALRNLINGINFSPMSKLLDNTRRLEMVLSGLFTLRWIILPQILKPSIYTFLNIAPMFMVAGYYLAFFFIISHNFEGAQIFNKTLPKNKDKSFLYYQVASSSNVGGYWLCMLNGGLNYQIEHHLFPRMNHFHYPKIAPIVKAFCKQRNIPYVHFDTVSDNVYSCISHLYRFGHESKPKNVGY